MNARVILSGLALIAFTSFASAQTGNGCGNENSTGKRTAFVDTNNNGVCDNYEDRKAVRNGNGNGNCYGRKGQRQRKGRNFADTSNNGVCDNRENLRK